MSIELDRSLTHLLQKEEKAKKSEAMLVELDKQKDGERDDDEYDDIEQSGSKTRIDEQKAEKVGEVDSLLSEFANLVEGMDDKDQTTGNK